jgi:hypothetical protein
MKRSKNMYKDKEELNEISKKNTPDLKELSNKFINDLLEIGVNLNMVEDILIYLDCKLRYIE